MIGIFADSYVSQQARSWQAFLDRLGRTSRDDDVRRTCFARIFGANVLEHHQRGRDVFELLAQILADPLTFGATVGAEAVFRSDVMDDLLAGRASGPGAAAPPPAPR